MSGAGPQVRDRGHDLRHFQVKAGQNRSKQIKTGQGGTRRVQVGERKIPAFNPQARNHREARISNALERGLDRSEPPQARLHGESQSAQNACNLHQQSALFDRGNNFLL